MSKKGFTLLEVLIVVIIIGILASIALPQYMGALKKASAAEAFTNLGGLRSSVDRYYYEQLAAGSYTTLSGDAWVDSLDVTVETTDWKYTIDDTTTLTARAYVITATRVGIANDWVTVNQDGTMVKSETLGGPAEV